MSYDLNILVNGNRCRQYLHNGRTFIEAKEGSEYAIELKNNSWEKILAVLSVDGLNIIDGEAADEHGGGYVLAPYPSQKFLGFQYSSEKVAAFKFGALGTGYASSKKDGSEKNAGIVGVRIWDEKPRPPIVVNPPEIHHHHHHYPNYGYLGTASYSVQASYNPDPHGWLRGTSAGAPDCGEGTITSAGTNYGSTLKLANTKRIADEVRLCCRNMEADSLSDKASFDMETQWGDSKTYKVTETTFERNNLVWSLDVYYASRESLIAMGVDLGTQRRVSFPESFKESKYAKPPKGWRG